MSMIFTILFWLVSLAIYFVPSIIAFKKERENKVTILLINIFLGWSLIGWIVALVMALKQPAPSAA